VRDGKVRHIGCSNFTGAQLAAAVQTLGDHQLCGLASHQGRFSILDRGAEIDVMRVANDLGVGNLVYSPLAEGLLTGKYRPEDAFPAGSRFAVASPANNYRARLTPRVMLAISSLNRIGLEHSVPPWKLALSWVLASPVVSSALVGPSTSAQVRQWEEAAGFAPSADVMRSVERINRAGGRIVD
jgi:aryl-alcohol dehydrogenase-like predicted oxidoreductase